LTPVTLDDIAEARRMQSRKRFWTYFPDQGPLRRELYGAHVAFFASTANYREVCFLAANRVGKTLANAYVTTCHLTGIYPAWWTGKRFTKAVNWWMAGDTGTTVRDILQMAMLGPPGQHGTGMIPGDLIMHTTPRPGLPEAVGTVWVKHVSGGMSRLAFKSYDQRRESFQGTEQDGVSLDEECPEDIYTECVLRTMTTGGLILLTFTPLMGLTPIVKQFIDEQRAPSRALVRATWDDAPHLSESAKAEMMASIPPWQRDARSKGIPDMGAGVIYPVPEADIVVADFAIPAHWPRAYGMDVGWNRTAAVWGATDRDTGVTYLYSEHYRGEAEPIVHAESIRSRGRWIPGVIDPASRGRGQSDGMQLYASYKEFGLDLSPADNGVEAGLTDTWTMLSTGKLKVFASLRNWRNEYRMYHRDEKGKIVKSDDHLMDATRYFVRSGLKRAKVQPVQVDKAHDKFDIFSGMGGMMPPNGAWNA